MNLENQNELDNDNVLYLVVDIVSSYVSRNSMSHAELPELIKSVHDTINSLQTASEEQEELKPAVSIRRSVNPDYLVCLEDGKKLTMLKRYLKTNYDMTPEEYRMKWGLPSDYPMVAPNYAEKRSMLAKKSGLGKLTGRKR